MLRLQPSEITISPEDIRLVNERLDMRKRARGKVRLHPGPERCRDEAITSLHERRILPYCAEEVSDEDNTPHSRSAQARARIGLGLASAQLQPPTSMLLRPLHRESSDSSSDSRVATVPIRAQLDGASDIATSSSFDRASASHRRAILAAWTSSGRLESLVGDWHSHPDGARHASATDVRSWSKLVKVTGKPIVGLIDCGASLPFAFSSAGRWLNKASKLDEIEDAGDCVVFRAGQWGRD